MRRKFALPAMLLILPVILLAACGRQPGYPRVDLNGHQVTGSGSHTTGQHQTLRVVLASITSPQETRVYYEDLMAYLGRKMGVPVEIVQRKTYAEANDLLRAGSADMAFVCTYAYVAGHDEFGMKLLAIPEINGKLTYQAYIVVNEDSGIKSFADLKGKTFAFTDPMSNTGTLYPLSLVKAMGKTPDSFFGKYFYTYSHDYAIRAVADRLADGASVDSTVFDYLRFSDPSLTTKLKIINTSPSYGMPPVVVRGDIPARTEAKLRQVLLNMNQDAEGKRILTKLHIDRFVPANDAMYNGVRQLAKVVGGRG